MEKAITFEFLKQHVLAQEALDKEKREIHNDLKKVTESLRLANYEFYEKEHFLYFSDEDINGDSELGTVWVSYTVRGGYGAEWKARFYLDETCFNENGFDLNRIKQKHISNLTKLREIQELPSNE